MLTPVFAVSTLLFAAVAGSSTADSCTASLPPLVIEGEGELCPTAGGGEIVSQVIQDASIKLEEVVRCKLGTSREYAVSSCDDLAEQKPDSPSGNYWILNSRGSPVQVFCEMGGVFPAGLNATGTWVRVAHLNMSDPNQQCPESLRLYTHTESIRPCGKKTKDYGCDSVNFNTHGLQYKNVCGRVRGYQCNTTDAFHHHFCLSRTQNNCTIDDAYVDGVSITHGNAPRKHIWTYAAGYAEDLSEAITSCPCTGSGRPPPRFVDSDYHCESGSLNPPLDVLPYYDDPLWDGQDCNALEATCCDPPNLPWFCKELPQPTTDDLEVRICGDEERSNEDVPIDLVELYIQ